ncbi:tetrameric acyl-CoA thioesterase [Ahniella affigens]|uniref:Tetrameric acyl-CoA thioesterase n=2 Tax=Ahniella affigens TaxID=2021234 RepID=A0A2P1PPI0_9GAMM|nr:tetrameric acyl-CoA thioesterase [Ahniella affigens]
MSKSRKFRWLMNVWPPFLFSGIRVLHVSPDFRQVVVRLKRYWFNQNYVGTHFGGSLFAMTDPYWMIMALENLGRDFIVWDKAAEIEFVKAVKEPVFARFELRQADIDALRGAAERDGKTLHWFDLPITTGDGTVVARVRKQVYVRRKLGALVAETTAKAA